MTPKTESGSLPTDATSSSQSGVIASKRHFDTFETQFFQQGESESAGLAGEVEHFDDVYESARRRRFLPSRQFMMGVAVGGIVGITLRITRRNGQASDVTVRCRIDTPIEIDYYQHGGILPYVLRQIIAKN